MQPPWSTATSTTTEPGHHLADEVLADQLGRLAAGDEHAADDQVGLAHRPGDGLRVRGEHLHPAEEDVVEVGELVLVDVEDGDVGAHADGDLRRVGADHAAAEDGHPAAAHAGHAAEEDALAAVLLLQAHRADLDGHAASDLAHRAEEGEAAVVELDGLVGDRGDLLLQEDRGELRVHAGEVEVGVDDLPFLHPRVLGRDRLLHLDDHLGALPHLVGRGDELRTGPRVVRVGEARADAGARLDDDLMSGVDERLHRAGHHADPVLANLDLLGDADNHGTCPPLPVGGSAGGQNTGVSPGSSAAHGDAGCYVAGAMPSSRTPALLVADPVGEGARAPAAPGDRPVGRRRAASARGARSAARRSRTAGAPARTAAGGGGSGDRGAGARVRRPGGPAALRSRRGRSAGASGLDPDVPAGRGEGGRTGASPVGVHGGGLGRDGGGAVVWALHTDRRDALGPGAVLDARAEGPGAARARGRPGEPGAPAARDLRAGLPLLHQPERLLRPRRGGASGLDDVQRGLRGLHLGSAGGRPAGLARADGRRAERRGAGAGRGGPPAAPPGRGRW